MLKPFTVCAPARDLVRELGGSVVRIREEVNMAGPGGQWWSEGDIEGLNMKIAVNNI